MAEQPGLCGTWSETPKAGFLTTRLIFLPTDNEGNNSNGVVEQSRDDVCVARDSFYGIGAFFIVGLALSVTVTCLMFFKTRNRRMRKDDHN